ncbi:prostaglandin reductase 3 isoform X1 [Pantherophis guttatus]|uniref:15-oxoprostaglandin 13-reductase n=1 Tax=Pantherophis guttatus TaxID=94885 RepID=A0A6P9CZI0_PANGU|nr:prostaglandin reductase 3 isoform X1 [Pantherophis guttatus]
MTFHGRISVCLKSRGAWHRWLNQQHLISPGTPSRVCLSAPPTRPIVDMSYSRHFMDFQGSSIPTSMKKLVVTKLNSNFREAVSLLHDAPVPLPGDGDLLVRNRFVGINASDINYSAGRYDILVKPPFDVGFEGIGEVVALGLSASANYTVGQSVAYVRPGAFAEYTVVPAKEAIPVPSMKPEFLTLLVSGTTAYISLKELGKLSEGKTVLVTAAAGGTGQFAVQLSKKAKCHVIGTCSTDEKCAFLKSIGCDRAINYKTENVAAVLKNEYPKGVDVVYESVGGEMYDLAINSLAIKGRLIIIGFISGYQTLTGLPRSHTEMLPAKLLKKSASIRGFFLNHYFSDYQMAMKHLVEMCEKREIVCEVDFGDLSLENKFTGLESVFHAIDYMYMGKNIGKIVVELPHSVNSKL